MGNPYGITLKPAWTEWAAKLGVSETIAAAVYLLGEARNAEDVVDKLNPGEIERVIDIIGHHEGTPREDLVAVLYEAERALRSAGRAVERAARLAP